MPEERVRRDVAWSSKISRGLREYWADPVKRNETLAKWAKLKTAYAADPAAGLPLSKHDQKLACSTGFPQDW
jgi:hypothetical protein